MLSAGDVGWAGVTVPVGADPFDCCERCLQPAVYRWLIIRAAGLAAALSISIRPSPGREVRSSWHGGVGRCFQVRSGLVFKQKRLILSD
jgi:hypothetical protein